MCGDRVTVTSFDEGSAGGFRTWLRPQHSDPPLFSQVLVCGVIGLHVFRACLWVPGRVGVRAALSGPRRVSLRLAPLHQLLQPMASCARVAQCAEAVPTLLRAFFSAVSQVSLLPGSPLPWASHTQASGGLDSGLPLLFAELQLRISESQRKGQHF